MSAASGLAIQELLLSAPTAEAVDAFIEGHDFPIREGPHTTFVYRGEATSVLLGHWLFGTAAAREMEQVPDSGPVVPDPRPARGIARRVPVSAGPRNGRGVDSGSAQRKDGARPLRGLVGVSRRGVRAAGVDRGGSPGRPGRTVRHARPGVELSEPVRCPSTRLPASGTGAGIPCSWCSTAGTISATPAAGPSSTT